MLEGLVLIDKLEDQIIDHPDASTTREINETSLDETFQNKLKAMAEQIESNQSSYDKPGDSRNSGEFNYQFLITRSHLKYEYSDESDMITELNEWFSYNDLSDAIGLHELHMMYKQMVSFSPLDQIFQNSLRILKTHTTINDNDSLAKVLKQLIYFSYGEYTPNTTKSQQLQKIKLNVETLILMGFYTPLIELLQDFLNRIMNKNIQAPFSSKLQANFFRILTLLYFMINILIPLPNKHFLEKLNELDLLSTIVKFIEFWKWNPNKHYRMRYFIMMTWKLILLEIGGSNKLKMCDKFLVQSHNIVNKGDKDLSKQKLTCSPLDYYAFREDLTDKYPLYDSQGKSFDFKGFHEELENIDPNSIKQNLSKQRDVPSSIEEDYQYFMAMNSFSNSLSNLIERPKTNKTHTVMSQLPAQTVHIATPVPSPNLSASDYLTGGEKIRRSYQVNQAMPFIYPNVTSTVDNTENTEVPFALKQADEILKNSIYESYSTKRLWDERKKFMVQERGHVNEYESGNSSEFDYDETLKAKYSANHSEINSLLRIEKFYEKNLVHLHTFVLVLIETIKANKYDYNLNYAEWELNPETSYFNGCQKIKQKDTPKETIDFILMSQLEVVNIKEITLKASSAIIVLLLKWFKISHVLKYYYFTSILFDQQFFTVSLDFMSKGFNNPNLRAIINNSPEKIDDLAEYDILINQNKIMNPKIDLPKFEFFNNCIQKFPTNYRYEFINKNHILNLPKINDYNNIKNVFIEKYNSNYVFILANLLTINNKILIKNLTQRIFTLNGLKPSELYKMLIINYNCPSLTIPILKTLKKLVPYQGRKWKSINMDLISQIYLNLKLSLKDNWLSGKDLETDFNNSYDQEIALRALIQFYNMRKYPNQMEQIGYKLTNDIDIPMLDLNDYDFPNN